MPPLAQGSDAHSFTSVVHAAPAYPLGHEQVHAPVGPPATLPAGTIDALLADPTGDLTNILLYHVVAGKVMAADVVTMNGQTVETVGGGTLTITVDGDTVMINNATVTTVDIETSNGVIHVIDTVLIPE